MCKNIYKLPYTTGKTNDNVNKYDGHSLMLMIIINKKKHTFLYCYICMLVSGVKNSSNELVGLWCGGKKSKKSVPKSPGPLFSPYCSPYEPFL